MAMAYGVVSMQTRTLANGSKAKLKAMEFTHGPIRTNLRVNGTKT